MTDAEHEARNAQLPGTVPAPNPSVDLPVYLSKRALGNVLLN